LLLLVVLPVHHWLPPLRAGLRLRPMLLLQVCCVLLKAWYACVDVGCCEGGGRGDRQLCRPARDTRHAHTAQHNVAAWQHVNSVRSF
jgi:hypothetical protein